MNNYVVMSNCCIGNYKIEFSRKENEYCTNRYSLYNFKISFKDKNTDLLLVEIDTNERMVYNCGEASLVNDRIWFDKDIHGNNYIIEIGYAFYDYPTEDDVIKIIICQYNSQTNTIFERLSIFLDVYKVEELIFAIWCSLEDLTYLKEIELYHLDGYCDFDDYLSILDLNEIDSTDTL